MPKKKNAGGGKKKGGGGSRKAEERMKKALIEDKTFGMKNKKGKKQQKKIATIKNQINSRGSGKTNKGGLRAQESAEYEKKKAKKKREKEAADMAKLLGIAKDEAKVLAGVKKKKKKKKPVTEGDALRAKGNAEAGAVSDRQAARRRLRKQRKKQKLAEIDLEDLMYVEETPIEEIIEEERKELIESGKPLTPVTLENFLEWKKQKKNTKDAKAIKAKELSGRLLFETDADKYNVDDEGAAAENEYDEIRAADEAEAEAEAESAAASGGPIVEEATAAAAVPAAAAAVFLDEGLDDLDDVDFDDES